MPEIHYLAVLVAGISNMVVGSIWYGPLFGKVWMEEISRNNPDFKEGMKSPSMGGLYLKQFILALIMSYVFAHVLWAFRTAGEPMTDMMAALQGAFWMWLGFVVPILYGASLWTGKKFKFVAIDLGYWLIVLAAMGLILSMWK